MSDLRFAIDEWTGVGQGPPEEVATRGLLRIEAGGDILTRNENEWSRSVSERVHLSMYPAALWLTANWWRLCYETARPAEHGGYDWRAAHELGAAGRGYLWPQLSVVPDGESVFVGVTPTRRAAKQPIRYLDAAEVAIALGTFERGCAEFVDTVVARLTEVKITGTDLEKLWHEVAAERADADTARTRRFEAMMHHDPDEAPPAALIALDNLVLESGADAAAELAGAVRSEDAMSALDQLKAASLNGVSVRGTWDHKAESASLAECRAIAIDRSLLPWQRGLSAARALRAAWSLGEKRFESATLETRLALPVGTLSAGAGVPGLPASLAIQDGFELRWLLRSRHPRSRRFEAARLLGDLLGSTASDAWHPATDLYTARQKFQRAFAAELLCPVEGLRQQLGSDRSESGITAAAEYFDVSELAVDHQVTNHLDRDNR